MPTINGRACVVNGTPVDKVFSNGKQVYGRNLVGFSEGTPEDVSHWQGSTPVTSEKVDGEYAFKLVSSPTTNPSNRDFGKLEMASVPTIKPSTRYFCQIQYKVTDTVMNPPVPNTNFAMRVLHSNDDKFTDVGVSIPEKTAVDSWQTISGFVTTPADASTVMQISMNQGFHGTIYFKKMIITESNVAVDWNRAPEDVLK